MRTRRVTAAMAALLAAALFAGSLTWSTPASAAVNKRVNFQGRLTDPATGMLLADGTYNVEFKLHDHATNSGGAQGTCSGSCLWMETRTLTNRVTVRRGLFSVQLGELSALSTFDFDRDPLYLSVRTGGSADTPTWDTEMTPRHRLGAAPQAIHASNASLLGGQLPSYYSNAANLTGTLADARLSTNVALRNVDNAFSTSQSVTGRILLPTTGATGGIVLGGDAELYRSAVGTLRTDDVLSAADLTCSDCIGASDLGAGSVGASEIADGSITATEIAQSVWSGTAHQAGLLSARPAAAPANHGVLYLATDVDGGTMYRSDGAAWVKTGRGATESVPPSGAAGGDLAGSYPSPTVAANAIGSSEIVDASVAPADLAAAVAEALVPPGTILPTGRATAPAGYLLADGAAVSRTTYAALFAAIGTAYGAGDGSTTFNVPDLRGRFPLGKAGAGTGSTLGGAGGSLDHTHNVPGHYHALGNVKYANSAPSAMDSQPGFVSEAARNSTGLAAAVRVGNGSGLNGDGSMASGASNPAFQAVNYMVKY